MGRRSIAIQLTSEERSFLESHLRRSDLGPRLAERVHIVLMVASGLPNKEVARVLRVGETKVSRWRCRFAARRLSGLDTMLRLIEACRDDARPFLWTRWGPVVREAERRARTVNRLDPTAKPLPAEQS